MPDHAVERFRSAVASVGSREETARIELESSIRTLVEVCRAAGWKAEQIVVAINTAWSEAVDRGVVPRDDEHAKLRREAVTKAIEAYYLQ